MAASTIVMRYGENARATMSPGGIAIAIGVMVDSSIIVVENAHEHLELDKERVAAGAPPQPTTFYPPRAGATPPREVLSER